jgi:hypothetical protein
MNVELVALGEKLVGHWTVAATHPKLPGEAIVGSCSIEWLEGRQFLIHRSHYDHAKIPDAISVIGDTDGIRMHYFDERGVHRVYDVTVTRAGWEIAMARDSSERSFASPDQPFSQRVSYTVEDEGQTMSGTGQLSFDDVHWEDDLRIVYRRSS